MISKAITKALEMKVSKGWEKTYWAFDIHETIIVPNWQAGNIPRNFYPYAREALQIITNRKDVVMILYTCSHPHEIEEYLSYPISMYFLKTNQGSMHMPTGKRY